MNDDTSMASIENSEMLQCSTNTSAKIRIGRTFQDSDGHYALARFSCVQLYDVQMSFAEMNALQDRCETLRNGLNGEPSGLILMYPFNKQHKCSSTQPVSRRHDLKNHVCALVSGPRGRERHALRITLSDIMGDRVLLSPVSSGGKSETDANMTSSFTLMYYLRLSTAGKLILPPVMK